MVPVNNLVSYGNRMLSFFVCRSGANISDFSFAEEALLNRALGCQRYGFPGWLLQL
jgi:hypothetical protein